MVRLIAVGLLVAGCSSGNPSSDGSGFGFVRARLRFDGASCQPGAAEFVEILALKRNITIQTFVEDCSPELSLTMIPGSYVLRILGFRDLPPAKCYESDLPVTVRPGQIAEVTGDIPRIASTDERCRYPGAMCTPRNVIDCYCGETRGIQVCSDAGTFSSCSCSWQQPMQSTGRACTKDAECIPGTCLLNWPGGYCSRACTTGGDCDAQSACVSVSGGVSRCLVRCIEPSDCRVNEGYSCANTSTGRVCTVP